MGQNRLESGTLVLPVCHVDTPRVLLPGVTYSASFPHASARALMGRFKNVISADILSPPVLSDAVTEVLPLSSSAEAGIELFIASNDGFGTLDLITVHNESADLKKFIALVEPHSQLHTQTVYTVIHVVAIEVKRSKIDMTLRAITRAITVHDHSYKLQKDEAAVQIDYSPLYRSVSVDVAPFRSNCIKLFSRIDSFKHEYVQAVKAKSSDLKSKYRTLLILNPLANALFVQFAGSKEFSVAFTNLKRLAMSHDTTPINSSSANFHVQLIDLVGAVLPFPAKFKVKLLCAFQLDERQQLINDMVRLFSNVFDRLKEDACFVDDWFVEGATDSQREDLIALQLRSIRKVLDDVGNLTSTPIPASASNRPTSPKSKGSVSSDSSKRPMGRTGRTPLSLDQNNDELEEIHIFVTKILPGIASLPDDAKKLVEKDYKRLLASFKSGATSSMDANILRNYLEVVMDIPWDQYTVGSGALIDINQAKQQLDFDHYGLHKVKTRLIQYLIVLKLLGINAKACAKSEAIESKIPTTTLTVAKKPLMSAHSILVAKENKSPIIMLVGPPGTGKTSLANSIAKSLNRQFQRVSLGGINDESDIRGHRRTYVGAMPGLIVQALRRARSMNPVILLDEIDKVTGSRHGISRVHGDPAAALLEVLDPEQNSTFMDHYLGIPVDLSQVIFVCTANDASTIPAALLDRLEIIELGSYDIDEKAIIAKRYLLPRQIKRNGFPPNSGSNDFVEVSSDILHQIITEYTGEAGVRGLDRLLATICRNKAVEYCESIESACLSPYNPEIHSEDLNKYLGAPRRFIDTSAVMTTTTNRSTVGIVNGLSYNSDASGSVLVFECVGIDKRVADENDSKSGPSLSMTGRLGEVLLESARIALIYVKLLVFRNIIKVNGGQERSLIEKLNSTDFYLHVPFGSIPKDGPSAGVTITLLFLSLVLNKDVPPDFAMTGEITLRGLVLPVGGVKEKILGAHLNGNIRQIIIPRDNRRDLIEEYHKRLLGKGESIQINMDEIWADDKNCQFQLHQVEDDIASRYGIAVHYAQEFYDVIKAIWGEDEEVSLTMNSRVPEHHL